MRTKNFFSIVTAILLLYPVFASAELFSKSSSLLSRFKGIIDVLIPAIFGLALVVFFWGIIKYIAGQGDNKDQGRRVMIWGVVALFVMSSIWGIVAFIQSIFIGDVPTKQSLPTIGGSNGLPPDCDFAQYGATGECR